ncbi:MAG: hypothetical protein CMP23_07170 [Rickettsiales bacterium]|nr:hypothetical protein [Rickettsiales bacterium]
MGSAFRGLAGGLALLALVLLSACGGKSEQQLDQRGDESPQEVSTQEVGGVLPGASPVTTAAEQRVDRNPPDGNRPAWGEFSAPFGENVHGGNGWAWVTGLGGSPRDFPGSAALVAPSRDALKPALSTLLSGGRSSLDRWGDIPGLCTAIGHSSAQGMDFALQLVAGQLQRNAASGAAVGRQEDEYWSQQCPGCPGAPTAADMARREDDSSLERHATAGVDLLVLEPPAGEGFWAPESLREKLLREVFRPPHPDMSILRLGREAARSFGSELHLAAPLPAALGRDNLWRVAGMLDLVQPVLRPGERADPSKRRAMALSLRSRGKRALLDLAELESLPEPVAQRRTALHLVAGGVVWSDRPEQVPSALRQMLAMATENPQLFFLPAARVGLYYSLASMAAAQVGEPQQDPQEDGLAALDFFGLARLLDDLHIPYTVVFAGDGVSVDDAFEPERLGLYDAILVPRTARMAEVEYQGLAAMSEVGAVVFSGNSGQLDLEGRASGRRPLRAVGGKRIFQLSHTGADYLKAGGAQYRAALAADLAPALAIESTSLSAAVKTSLPGEVFIDRKVDPRTSTLIHHFVPLNDELAGGADGEHWVRLPGWPRGAQLDYELQWYDPAASAPRSLPYRWDAEARELEVKLPALAAWNVLTLRARLALESVSPDARVQVDPPAFDDGSEDRETWQVSFTVPQWPGGKRNLTLRAPEDVVAGGLAGLTDDLRAQWQRSPDGSSALLTARNQLISLRVGLSVGTDFVDVTTSITNLRDQSMAAVEAMFCLDPGDLHHFPERGLDRNYLLRGGKVASLGNERHGSGSPNFTESTGFDLPLTVLESVDDRWSLGHAFEASGLLGANGSGGGVCVHTRPRFGDLAPGQEVVRRGRIYMASGRASNLFERFQREKPFDFELRPAAEPRVAHPCKAQQASR